MRLDRDLDHVVLRAMAKSQSDRYASCAQFADDLRRFLAGQAVLATNAGWRYRATKFARRHRISVTLGILIAAALLTSTLIALRQAHIANIERDRAAEVNRFLQEMLSAADPNERGRDVTVASLLDTAAASLLQDTGKDDDVVAALRITLAETYNALGLLDPALAQARAAAAIAGRSNGLDDATRAHAFETLAEVLRGRSEEAQARQWAQRAASFADPAAIDWVGQAENLLGIIDRHDRHFADAETHYRRALDVYQGRGTAPDAHVAVVLQDLGVLRLDQGDIKEAIQLHEQALAIERRIHPAPHPQTAAILSSLADARAIDKDYAGAESAYKEALSIRESLLGEAHPDTLFTMTSYANLLDLDLHRYAEAEAIAQRSWDLARAHLPNPHQQTAYAGITLADALMHLDRAGDAVPILRETLAIRSELLPADSPLVINTQSLLGAALARSGNVAEGEPMMRDAVSKLTASMGGDNTFTRRAADRLKAFDDKKNIRAATQASSDH
jgi:serine/threonine-protein kinase